MKIPVRWLKDYVELPAKSQELADRLTLSGTAVENITRAGDTDVLHLEITTNRADCLSLLGIAQEVAAVTGKKMKPPAVPRTPCRDKCRLPLQIEIRDKKGCPYYVGRAFDQAKIQASPDWLRKKLEWMGQAGINNVVDVTNFTLFEQGQPLHAFDYDKVRGNQIIVRRARKGEKLVAINKEELTLDERILVIADAERAIAVAGVMGGLDTEVTSSTKRIILESAQFDPALIRRASRFLKLGSESSYRFERGIDPCRVKAASDRATDLFLKIAGACPASKPVEAGRLEVRKKIWVPLRLERASMVLGRPVSGEKVLKILSKLGFKAKKKSKNEFRVKSLSHRPDVTLEADLIEEIVRIEGFEKTPEAIPMTRHAEDGLDAIEKEYRLVRSLKQSLVGQGFYEAVTFSLVSRSALLASGWPSDKEPVRVQNPLSLEQEVLTPTGIPGMLGVLSKNVNRKVRDILFFEVAKRFESGGERLILTLGVTGAVNSSWENKQESSFYYLKGVVANALKTLGKRSPEWVNDMVFRGTFEASASMFLGEKRMALCGVLRPEILKNWDIPQPVYLAEIDLDLVFGMTEPERVFKALPNYPPARRDIAIVTDKTIPVRKIVNFISEAGKPHLRDVALFDEYKGKHIPKDKRSLAFSLEYQKPDGTFTEEEIRLLQEKVRSGLEREFQVSFR